MEDEIKTYLYDILTAIDEIEGFFAESPKIFADYKKDIRTKRAVERDIEIIGEAMNRILKMDNSIAIEHSRNIVATRNRIIHGYDSVSDETIWGTIIRHLPVLKEEIKNLIDK